MRIVGLLALIAGVYLASFATQGVFTAFGIPIDLTAASGLGQIVHYLIVLICAYLFTTAVWRQSVIGFFLLYWRNWRKSLRGFAFCAGLTVSVALLWFLFILGVGGARWSSAAWAQTGAHALAKLFFTSLIAIVLASTEEILYRSLAFKYLLSASSPWIVVRATLLSSIIFALGHHFHDPSEWLQIKTVGLLLGLVLLGCMLALVYYLTNSLACSIGVHSGLIWVSLAKKTQIIQVAPSGWQISNSFDPRSEPAAWILFIFLAILFWSLRRWMRKDFEIEDLAAVADAANVSQLKVNTTEHSKHDRSLTSRDRLVATLGGVACIAGFLAIQNVIECESKFAAQNHHAAVGAFETAIARGTGVSAAASAAGFQPGDYVRMVVDQFRRLPNGKVELSGWAADRPGDGTPMVLFVLAGNTTIFQTKTEGGREDVARTLMLTDAAARNVKFYGAFTCKAKEPLRIMATTSAMTYYPIPVILPCP